MRPAVLSAQTHPYRGPRVRLHWVVVAPLSHPPRPPRNVAPASLRWNKATTMHLSPAASVKGAGGSEVSLSRSLVNIWAVCPPGSQLGTLRAPLLSPCPHPSAPDLRCAFKGRHLEILDNSSFQRDLTSRLIS